MIGEAQLSAMKSLLAACFAFLLSGALLFSAPPVPPARPVPPAPPAAPRMSISLVYVFATGKQITLTVPNILSDGAKSGIVIPLRFSPAEMWIVTVNPDEAGGQVYVRIDDASRVVQAAPNVLPAPATIFSAAFPFAYGKTIPLIKSDEYTLSLEIIEP
jgi:hypothetical protein